MSLQDALEQINNLDLNDIDWSRVGVWPLYSRIFVWLLAVAAVLALTYFFVVKDLHSTLQREIVNEQKLRKNFERKVFQSATLEQQRKLMTQMEKDVEFLISQLPKKTQVPGLLDDIDEKGRVSGLQIVSIKLQPEVLGEYYVTLPIEIIVTGTYHNLGSFVSGIAGMPRIITLHDFTVTSSKDSSGLKMTIKARTYRSLDEESA